MQKLSLGRVCVALHSCRHTVHCSHRLSIGNAQSPLSVLLTLCVASFGVHASAQSPRDEIQPPPVSTLVQPDQTRQTRYDSYIICENTAGEDWSIEALQEGVVVATLHLSTDRVTWMSVTATTSQGVVVFDYEKSELRVLYSLNGLPIGTRTRVGTNDNETEVYADFEFLPVQVDISEPASLLAISDVLLDPNIRQYMSIAAGESLPTVWNIACTYAECDNVYPPGGSPSNTLGNCLCKCCTDSGGCWRMTEHWYGESIGCGGLGWAGFGYVACGLLCFPSIPFH